MRAAMISCGQLTQQSCPGVADELATIDDGHATTGDGQAPIIIVLLSTSSGDFFETKGVTILKRKYDLYSTFENRIDCSNV